MILKVRTMNSLIFKLKKNNQRTCNQAAQINNLIILLNFLMKLLFKNYKDIPNCFKDFVKIEVWVRCEKV